MNKFKLKQVNKNIRIHFYKYKKIKKMHLITKKNLALD